MQDRIDRLEYRLRQQEKRLRQRIEGVETRMSQLEKAAAAPAALPAGEAAVQTSVTVASAPSEPAVQTAPLPGKALSSVPAKLPSAPAAMAKPAPSASAPAGKANPAAVRSVHPATAAEQAAYDEALSLLRKGEYEKAAKVLDDFLKQYPDSALAPNAAYWAGEAYMVRLAFDKAWQRFRRVIDEYPTSNKYGDSLLRGADALARLGKKKEAEKLLHQLIANRRLPDRLKVRARKRLDALQKEAS